MVHHLVDSSKCMPTSDSNIIVYSFQEMFNAESSSEPRIGLSDKEHMLGTTCTDLDSEKSDRLVL